MAISRNGIVPDDIAAYAVAHSTPRDAVQEQLADATEAATGAAAGMQIGADQGLFMEILARAIGAKRVIEIGTFTGYSSLAVARGIGPDGRLLCCDVSEEWTAIAREHWELAGVADRVIVMYLGHIVEQGTTDEVFYSPSHPYTRGLISSLPRLDRRSGSGQLRSKYGSRGA